MCDAPVVVFPSIFLEYTHLLLFPQFMFLYSQAHYDVTLFSVHVSVTCHMLVPRQLVVLFWSADQYDEY